jgi:hypothetical protein
MKLWTTVKAVKLFIKAPAWLKGLLLVVFLLGLLLVPVLGLLVGVLLLVLGVIALILSPIRGLARFMPARSSSPWEKGLDLGAARRKVEKLLK